MQTTKTAQPTTASIDGDALQFECVTFSHFVRHQLNRIMSLPYMHTAPRKTRNAALNTQSQQPSPSRGADLSFVRPKHPLSTHNPIPLSSLPLCQHKHDILGLLRPSIRATTHHPPPTAHNPPPTTHHPPPTTYNS
jgi:hypothetical protein